MLSLNYTVLSWRVKPRKKKRAERNRGERNRKKKRCFISRAAEAKGTEVNVDFYT